LAAWATFGVALGAAVIGLRQYRATAEATRSQADASRRQIEAAERLAEDEARPYVVAYMESLPRNPQFVDLVVRNFGKTAATFVTVSIDPAPRRSAGGGLGGGVGGNT
jgi:methylphosphotriester-DNA--protein-cysteine methyltransferase